MESYNRFSLEKDFEERIIVQLRKNLLKALSSYHQVTEAKVLF